jgi:CrcB protein
MMRFLFVCLGGAAGTGARYLLGGWIQRALGVSFPFGTIAINAAGSFLISILMYLGLEKQALPADLRVVLTTGVLGGFTTYSSFNYETLRLFQDGALMLAVLNLAATVVACLAAGGMGLVLARVVAG